MGVSLAVLGVMAGVVALVGPVSAQGGGNCPAGPNVAGIVIGSILATLAVVGIIIGIIFLVRWKRNQPKKAKAATKTGDVGLEQAHVNPAFQDDTLSAQKPEEKVNDVNFAEQGFAGYVPCKEYDRPITKEVVKSPPKSNGSLGRIDDPFVGKLPIHHKFGSKLKKAGSHGSLDDSFPSLAGHSSEIELSKMRSMDPEVINVPLQSQDIIGLGFNICGNLRDGIYVSQVLNRGPASESRLIEPGDRILGITISFENMVYEDALTILSYASPYPVKLQVQKKSLKASDPDIAGEDYEEALHLHHPKYRSQSMDDVSKIAQESLSRMRRAWSEMKRGSSKRKQEEEVIVEENRLRRWSGKPNSGEPVGDTLSDEKSDNSTVSIPDLPSDMPDLAANININKGEVIEATVHHPLETVPLDSDSLGMEEVNLEEISLNQTEAPTLGLSPKRQAEADRKEGLRLSYEVDHSIKKLDLEEPIDLELRTEASSESMKEEVTIERPHADLSDTADRRSPSPVIISEGMGLGLKIGASCDDAPDPAVHLVPDVGQEVAVCTEAAYNQFAVVTEHDGYLDIDLQDVKTRRDDADSSSPPPSPPPVPPPMLSDDSGADVTESSMLVLVNEESILKREDLKEDNETAKQPVQEEQDESFRDVFKDYFSDRPSLMESLGLNKPRDPSSDENEEEKVLLTKRLSSDSKPVGHEPLLDAHFENGKALREAKEAIRRRSSSSEEAPHVSSPSSLSSRSSSPTEHQEDEEYHLSLEHGGEASADLIKGRERVIKSHSSLVSKHSGGGLSYDISPTDFEEMAVDVPDKEGINSPGGVAYYVSIDEKFHGIPPIQGAEEEEEDIEEKPSLVKAWGFPNMAPAPPYDLDHSDTETATSKQINEVVTIETVSTEDRPRSIITETRTSTVTMSNNNNIESGLNGKGGDNMLPFKTTREVVATEVSKSNEVIRVTRHEEIQGGFTLTVNTASHNDDSEA